MNCRYPDGLVRATLNEGLNGPPRAWALLSTAVIGLMWNVFKHHTVHHVNPWVRLTPSPLILCLLSHALYVVDKMLGAYIACCIISFHSALWKSIPVGQSLYCLALSTLDDSLTSAQTGFPYGQPTVAITVYVLSINLAEKCGPPLTLLFVINYNDDYLTHTYSIKRRNGTMQLIVTKHAPQLSIINAREKAIFATANHYLELLVKRSGTQTLRSRKVKLWCIHCVYCRYQWL